MAFSSGAVCGPGFFLIHARVLFKHSNLRKGTPALDHRPWISGGGWWVLGEGEHPLGWSPGSSWMKTAWLLMGDLWVVQSTSRWHLLTHVSLAVDDSLWNVGLLSLKLWMFKILIYPETALVDYMLLLKNSKQVALGVPEGSMGFLTSSSDQLFRS